MKLGIFSRSTVGYLIVLFLLGTSNVYAILKLIQFNEIILRNLDVDIRAIDLGKRLVDSVLSQRRYEQKYLLTRDAVLYNQFLAEKDDFNRYLDEIRTLSVSPTLKRSFENIRLYHQRYRFLVDTEVHYMKGNRDYDRNRYRGEKERASDAILGELEKLDDDTRRDVITKTRMVSESGDSARKTALASLLITILLAIMLSFYITRGITKPLIRLVGKTREIPAGTFDCDLDVSAPPEIAELAMAFNLMCDRLKEVDRIKADFFSTISHELRTPLTTIQEGTNLLLEGAGGNVTEKQGKLLTIISAEGNRLTSLVNSILELSKMEAGMMIYNFVQGDLVRLIEQAGTEIAPYMESKKIHLEKKIHSDLPSLRMDGERVLQVLRNLIGNAVKFTPEGGRITIAATPANGGVEVSVSDSGPGIPGKNLTNIFGKYESSDPKKGTGLGLAIVKHIVAAHGGKVWAESEPGKGSRFVFVLPS
jgi:two-component system, NtrC family, sensor histidine kinase GlrK